VKNAGGTGDEQIRGLRYVQLAEEDYQKLLEPLRAVPINTYFARAVLAGRIGGRVLADAAGAPKSFYVRHDYGMSLLFGRINEAFFGELFGASARQGSADDWLQAYPRAWDVQLNGLVDHGRATLYGASISALMKGRIEATTGGLSRMAVLSSDDGSLFDTLEGAVVRRRSGGMDACLPKRPPALRSWPAASRPPRLSGLPPRRSA
jgi:hypothetical protein